MVRGSPPWPRRFVVAHVARVARGALHERHSGLSTAGSYLLRLSAPAVSVRTAGGVFSRVLYVLRPRRRHRILLIPSQELRFNRFLVDYGLGSLIGSEFRLWLHRELVLLGPTGSLMICTRGG